jgi:hypothetical protein
MEPWLAGETVEIGADELAVLHTRVVYEVRHASRRINLIIGAAWSAFSPR